MSFDLHSAGPSVAGSSTTDSFAAGCSQAHKAGLHPNLCSRVHILALDSGHKLLQGPCAAPATSEQRTIGQLYRHALRLHRASWFFGFTMICTKHDCRLQVVNLACLGDSTFLSWAKAQDDWVSKLPLPESWKRKLPEDCP